MPHQMPKLFIVTIYVDANGELNFDSIASDGTESRNKDAKITMKRNDYLKWRIGGNLKDAHKPITAVEVNSEQTSIFNSTQFYWIWPSGDNPAGSPECILYNANAQDYRFGVAASFADGSTKLGEIVLTVSA